MQIDDSYKAGTAVRMIVDDGTHCTVVQVNVKPLVESQFHPDEQKSIKDVEKCTPRNNHAHATSKTHHGPYLLFTLALFLLK